MVENAGVFALTIRHNSADGGFTRGFPIVLLFNWWSFVSPRPIPYPHLIRRVAVSTEDCQWTYDKYFNETIFRWHGHGNCNRKTTVSITTLLPYIENIILGNNCFLENKWNRIQEYVHKIKYTVQMFLFRLSITGPCNTYQFKVLKSFEILNFWNFDQSFKISKFQIVKFWSFNQIIKTLNKGNSSIPLFKTHKSMYKKQNRGNKLKPRETH